MKAAGRFDRQAGRIAGESFGLEGKRGYVMKAVRPFAVALSVVAVGFACERSPVGVPQPPAPTTDLVSCSELPYESVTQVIGPEGGTISFGPHTLVIPAGALAPSGSLTARARPPPR